MLRNHFPIPKHITYLDTAYCGLIHNAAQDESFFSAKAYRNAPSETRLLLSEEIIPNIKLLLGKFLNIDSGLIALTSSFSAGFNTLLANIPEGKIMFNDQDYPSLRYPFEHGRFSTVVTHSMTPWKQ
ncbi:MAG: hypothetical protein AAF193_02750, partial [Bacteroidota bacterium]